MNNPFYKKSSKKIAGPFNLKNIDQRTERRYYQTTLKDPVSSIYIPEYDTTYNSGEYLDTRRNYFKIIGIKEDSSDVNNSIFELQEYDPFEGKTVGSIVSRKFYQINGYEIRSEEEMKLISESLKKGKSNKSVNSRF